MMNNRQGGDALISYVSSMFNKGGPVAAFQVGGSVDTDNDRSFEDSVADAMAAGADLESALDSAEAAERDSGNDRSYEDTVADALAGGMDLNTALDFADEAAGRDGDEDRAAAPVTAAPVTAEAATTPPAGGDSGDSGATAGILGAISRALDLNKDGRTSPLEAALSIATPIGPMVAFGRGLENLATSVQFGTKPGSEQTGMIAAQQRGLYGDDEDDRDSGRGDKDMVEAAPEIAEALTIEQLTKPPTIDIVPFRPEDFYYFRPGSFASNRGIPSMMNMRTS